MKETKIYMELPSSCDECPIEHCGEYCTLNGVEIDTWSYSNKRPKDCPLIDIKDHDRELVKEVCEKIARNVRVRKIRKEWYAIETDLRVILDEIQRNLDNE